MSNFKKFNFCSEIQSSLDELKFVTPTPIQEKSIGHLLEKRDLLGIAQTGTGKTAAFSLPMLELLKQSGTKARKNQVQTLILAPTRELASQIELNIQEYSKNLNFSSLVVFGGVGKTPQINKLNRGVDILIATPGRLLDLMSDGHIDYTQLKTLILDEADTMLDMGFLKDVKRIISKIPSQRQTLLFSATMPKEIERLTGEILNKPLKVEITPESTTVDRIDQKVFYMQRENKFSVLLNILEDKNVESVLVFTKTKYNADRVVKNLLKVPISAAAIHSNKSQGARERSLGGFRSGEVRVLVATDIAARGIDVSHVTHVINYNLPDDPKNYVHRIGRTARAGRVGVAISLCVGSELPLLKSVEKVIKKKIPLDINQPFHDEIKFHPDQVGPAKSKKPQKKRSSKPRRRR